jgi:beta-mannosidase
MANRRRFDAAKLDLAPIEADYDLIMTALTDAVRLIGSWQMALAAPGEPMPSGDWIAAPVPGTAAEALRAAGRWDDAQPTPLHDKDVWYRTRFADRPAHRALRGPRHPRRGLAERREILESDNMFLAHEVEVELSGDNDLLIAFRSLDQALEGRKGRARWRTRDRREQCPAAGAHDPARPHDRLAAAGPCGWPWRSIRFVDGPRDVELRATLRWRRRRVAGFAAVRRSGHHRGRRSHAALARTSLRPPRRDAAPARVERWWPHTHGTPALYDVTLRTGGRDIDLGRTGFARSRSIATATARASRWSSTASGSLPAAPAGVRRTWCRWRATARGSPRGLPWRATRT